MEFRTLQANEIDVRVAQTFDYNGKVYASLLLYKDARVDMRLLDEVVGPLNWKRSHSTSNGYFLCCVSIWDASKKEWITKEDVGSESNQDAEKGHASDSFKRACFNWGIGRELYTAPRIVIELSFDRREYKKDERGKVKVNATFTVAAIDYDEARSINKLVIIDKKLNVRYELK